MSEISAKTKSDLSKRELEAKAGKGRFAVGKMVVATLWKNFVVETLRKKQHEMGDRIEQSKIMVKKLIELSKVCSEKKLQDGIGIYAPPYFLSGANIDYSEIDKRVKKKELPSHACYFGEKAHLDPLLHRYDDEIAKYKELLSLLEQKLLDEGELNENEQYAMMQYKRKLVSNDLNPLSFDKDERAAGKFSDLMESLVLGDFVIDEKSKKNIADAYALSKKTGKKLVLNCNHAGHTDANLIALLWSYLVKNNIIPGEKDLPHELQMKLRLLCGFYMATTPGIRTHLAGSNVLLVPGINDMEYFTKTLGARAVAELFQYVRKGFGADADSEVMVVFSGAGRGEYGGLKEEIPVGSERYLTREDCVYCDVHFSGSDNMYTAFSNNITAFNRFAPQEVKVAFGEPYIGGEKTIEEIFNDMVAQRDELQPDWKGAEKVVHAQREHITSLQELADYSLVLELALLHKDEELRASNGLTGQESIKEVMQVYKKMLGKPGLRDYLIKLQSSLEDEARSHSEISNISDLPIDVQEVITNYNLMVEKADLAAAQFAAILTSPDIGNKAKAIHVTK